MDLRLLVVQGKPEGKEIPIRVPRFIIGRSPECQLRPNSEQISRTHCQFSVNGEEVRLRDLGSSNGTIVNGERITDEVEINNGDLVQVGPLGFQVMLQHTATLVASTPAVAAPATVAPVGASAIAAQTAPAPLGAATPAKLGNKEAKANDIEQWLISDEKNRLPDSGSGVYSGDTQMLETAAISTDTTPMGNAVTPAEGVKKSEEGKHFDKSGAELVELADGRKVKIGSAKQKIDKTHEDTSRAAADIIRRMMERRPR